MSCPTARITCAALAGALLTLAACTDDPVSAYPPGPAKTAPVGAPNAGIVGVVGVVGGGITPGCPIASCTIPQPRILFSDSTGLGTQYSVNPDGTGLATEASATREGTWLPGRTRWVGVTRALGTIDDLCAFTLGTSVCDVRYTTLAAADVDPTASPDGHTLAFASDRPIALGPGAPGQHRIYAVPTAAQKGKPTETGIVQLSVGSGDQRWPHYSPDGTYIVFASDEPLGLFQLPAWHLWRMQANGYVVLPLSKTINGRHPVYSPDGKTIAFTTSTAAGERIALMPANGGPATILQNGLTSAFQPTWSPDGKRIAFASNDPAWKGIDVMNADGTGVAHVADFGSMPKWAR